jgi:hypothetical protein
MNPKAGFSGGRYYGRMMAEAVTVWTVYVITTNARFTRIKEHANQDSW